MESVGCLSPPLPISSLCLSLSLFLVTRGLCARQGRHTRIQVRTEIVRKDGEGRAGLETLHGQDVVAEAQWKQNSQGRLARLRPIHEPGARRDDRPRLLRQEDGDGHHQRKQRRAVRDPRPAPLLKRTCLVL